LFDPNSTILMYSEYCIMLVS